MERKNTKSLLIAFVITLAASGLAFGQDSVALSVAPSALRSLETRGIETGGIAEGQELKIEGFVITQNDDSFTVREPQGRKTVIVVTQKTLIKKVRKGWFYGPRSSGADEIRCGLKLKIKGQGNSDGQLVAKNITIEELDPKTVKAAESRAQFFVEPTNSTQPLADMRLDAENTALPLWTIFTTQLCGKCGHNCRESCAASGCSAQSGCN
jgi:hypothetical protein